MTYLNSAQAKQMALSALSAPGRNGYSQRKVSRVNTNRDGIFYFLGSQTKGFIVDARCLSTQEYDALRTYCTPQIAVIYHDAITGKAAKLINPFRKNSRSISVRMSWHRMEFEVFCLTTRDDACLAQLLLGVSVEGDDDYDAMAAFERAYSPSNHERLILSGLTASLQKIGPSRPA